MKAVVLAVVIAVAGPAYAGGEQALMGFAEGFFSQLNRNRYGGQEEFTDEDRRKRDAFRAEQRRRWAAEDAERQRQESLEAARKLRGE